MISMVRHHVEIVKATQQSITIQRNLTSINIYEWNEDDVFLFDSILFKKWFNYRNELATLVRCVTKPCSYICNPTPRFDHAVSMFAQHDKCTLCYPNHD